MPDDRKRKGILPDLSVMHNISIGILGRIATARDHRRATRPLDGRGLRQRLEHPLHNSQQEVSGLSGGNQQKVILARALAEECRVLLLAEPTRGVDVGAKAEIYTLIDGLVADGMAVLLQSSELPELLRLANRCIVFAAGARRASCRAPSSPRRRSCRWPPGSTYDLGGAAASGALRWPCGGRTASGLFVSPSAWC